MITLEVVSLTFETSYEQYKLVVVTKGLSCDISSPLVTGTNLVDFGDFQSQLGSAGSCRERSRAPAQPQYRIPVGGVFGIDRQDECVELLEAFGAVVMDYVRASGSGGEALPLATKSCTSPREKQLRLECPIICPDTIP